MAGSVNKVILVGNLGRDPEVRAMQNGERVCNLSIATSERWRDKSSGEQREKTEWHRVVIFSQPLVDIAERYLRKGSNVYLEGALQTRKWTDQSGQEKYSTEVVLQRYKGELTLLGGRGEGGGGDSYGGGNSGGGYQSGGGGSGGGGRGFGSGPNDRPQGGSGGGFGNGGSGAFNDGGSPFDGGGNSGGGGGGSSFGGSNSDLDDDIPF